MIFDRNICENEVKMAPKIIQNPSQRSLKTSSKREVNSEEGLISDWHVYHDVAGVKFAREGGDLGG